MKITPLNDRVLVKRIDALERTAGGIYLPSSTREKPSQGEIVAVGQGKISEEGERISLDVKVGDLVSYASYAGSDVKVQGVDYVILREEDILGIILSEEAPKKNNQKARAAKS